MTGQDFQDKLDAIVLDLQTTGKGQTVKVALRDEGNTTVSFPLSSDVNGVVNAAQLAPIQSFIDGLKPIADAYETQRAPVQAALETFKTEQSGHQALIDATSAARTALSTALEADVGYQAAKAALDGERLAPAYISAVTSYRNFNVSENFGNLSDAKGKYEGVPNA